MRCSECLHDYPTYQSGTHTQFLRVSLGGDITPRHSVQYMLYKLHETRRKSFLLEETTYWIIHSGFRINAMISADLAERRWLDEPRKICDLRKVPAHELTSIDPAHTLNNTRI